MKYLESLRACGRCSAGSFEKHLTVDLRPDGGAGEGRCGACQKRYREIIAKLPEFDKRDRFEMNIVNCAMLAAFILCMPQRPDIKTPTELLRRGDDDAYDEGFLPREREQCPRPRTSRACEGDGGCARAIATLFVEHGLFRVRGRQRLRGALHDLRHLAR